MIGIPIVAYLSGQGHWTTAFIIGAAFSALGAIAWLGIDAEERLEPVLCTTCTPDATLVE